MTVYLVILSGLLLWTLLNVSSLPTLKKQANHTNELVSILVPLRNEEGNVATLINHLKNLTYKNVEIILYNDNSTDETLNLLIKHTKNDSRFVIIDGIPLTDGWVGKVHACHELSKHAKGSYFVYIDADVRLHPHTIERILYQFEHDDVDMITGFPRFLFTNWLDKLLIPMMHFLVYVYLPILLANKTKWPAASAANGTFISFKAESYFKMNGHESVKTSLIEDIDLAREMKRNGMRVKLMNIKHSVACKMYDNAYDTWMGFTKNSFRGLNNSIIAAFFYTLFVCTLFILPTILAVIGLIKMNLLLMMPFIIVTCIHVVVYWKSGANLWMAFLHAISQSLLLGVIWHAAYMYKTKQRYSWKGRQYE